jgi:trimeric autotransporter adhesin
VIAGPDSVAVGDFNGDGIADLAVAGSDATVLQGNGDGTFTASVTLPRVDNFDIQYQWLVPADFNGDGRTDIAGLLNNEDDSLIAVLLSETQSATATANNISVSPAGLNLPTHLVEVGYPGDTAYIGSISGTVGLMGQAPFTLSGATNTPINILPGASGSTAVTVTPVAGFTGNVALTCSIATLSPAVATPPTCSIGPSVTLSGTTASTATLTIATQVQTNPADYAVTVTGSSGGASETITYQPLVVPFGVFTMTGTAVSVEAGSTGNSTITITPTASFTGTVALQCAVTSMPSAGIFAPTCSVPQPVAISGTTVATVSVAISTQLSTTTGDYVVTVTASATNAGTTVTATVPVTVTTGPNFTLSSTAVNIAPGASGTSTMTVTPSLGFTGSVTLTCVQDYEPDQPTCTSPAPVTISGTAPVTAAITVSTDAATAPGNYTLEVDSPSLAGSLKHAFITVTVGTPVPVAAFSLTSSAVNIASPGATGTSTITVTPSGGFTGTVALSCTVTGPAGAVDPPTCAVPTQATVTGTGAVTATLTVYTTGVVAKAEQPLKRLFTIGGGAAMSALFFFGIPAPRRRWKTFLSLLIFAFIGGAVIGCGGMANMAAANPGTTLGAYTVTVTGTSGATVQSTAVSVGVN